MIGGRRVRQLFIVVCSVALAVTGCSFDGVNSLPLPGAVGRGADAHTYHVKIANVGTLESNSPVMINDVIVGSVGRMTVEGWHADVEISVKPDVVVPANAVASVGQTSLLGSMHLALNPPLGEAPDGRLQPGATLGLNESSTYPSTEQTLAALSTVVNGGGLGQIGEIIHNFNAALSGREDDIRELLTRLDKFVGVLDRQRENIIASIQRMDRLAGTFAGQTDVIDRALEQIPPALDVLIAQRPNFTAALDKLGEFSDTATALVNDTKAELVANLRNLEPALRSLVDVGPDLGPALGYATHFPMTQSLIDRGVRGDYMNLWAVFDLTVPRLKRTLFLGTRWGEKHAKLVPAPGDPWYLNYSRDPLGAGANPPPPELAPEQNPVPMPPMPFAPSGPMPTVHGPILPKVPSPRSLQSEPAQPAPSSQIFAGPYPAEMPAPPAPAPGGGG